jgi:lipooligosaccharide transport system ATP-binding protein
MIVQARALTKRFAERLAVDRVDLDVPPGICFGLLGPNGAGKTTTLRMIYGVTRPSGGSIHVFGIDITADPRAVRRRLGVTLQESVLIEPLSPVENLRVFGRYHLLREPELSRRIDELIGFLELGSHADVPVQRLSGGFKRRLAIGLSLINRPELLILDEPTTGLDPAVRLALWARVRDLRAAGTTVLLTTHYMDEAQRLCDRVAIVAGGRVIAEDTPRALIAKHAGREAVEFDCGPEEEARWLDGGPPPRHRLRTGRRLILYVDDATGLVERLHQDPHLERRDLVVRPSNLEDVFLRLAGSSLEGGA